MNKNIFNSYETVETALLNELATEVRTKGKKARTLKGENYYVKFDGVWYDVTPEQSRIYKLIRNNCNMFVEQLNSARADILGVWANVWGERLPHIIADLEKGIEICQKYFDAFKEFITKSDEEEVVEVEEMEEKNEESEVETETTSENETSNDKCETSVVEYKLIKGFEDYMVSSDGKVWSLKHGKMKELKPRIRKDGYLDVSLRTNGQRVMKLVHRLVTEAFKSNPDNKPQVNHRDQDKTNNCAKNLEWCTGDYNVNYGDRNERVAKTLTNRKDLSTPVVCLETGVVYPSTEEAGRQTGIKQTSICKCINGKYKTAGGYHWAKFVEGNNPIYD